MKGHICHVNIPADNLESLQGFYSGVFEWDFEKMPGDMQFFGIKHGDEKPGAGMMPRQEPSQEPTFFICVDSVEAALNRVRDEGGSVIVPRTAAKGIGWYAIVLDPQKNHFGLWQADDKAA